MNLLPPALSDLCVRLNASPLALYYIRACAPNAAFPKA